MLSTCYVGRKLITVSTAVATHVALKWVAETVATHVDGEHYIVQENDSAVATGVYRTGRHSRLAISSRRAEGFHRRQRDGLAVGMRKAVVVVQPTQQVGKAECDWLGHLGAIRMERFHAEGLLIGT